MCFFVCAPGKEICLEYVSEHIKLHKDGTSEVIVDINLRNASDSSIEELLLIYPNTFFYFLKNKAEDKLYAGYEDDRVADITETLPDTTSPHNWFYKGVGASLNPEYGTAGEMSITLSLPDPQDPADNSKDVIYTGVIGEQSELKLIDNLDTLDYLILDRSRFCPFRVELGEDFVAPGVSRWFRWYFHGRASAINRLSRARKQLTQKLTNSQYFIYEIWGPYDTRNRLRTFLRGALRNDAYHTREDYPAEYASSIRSRAQKLLRVLFDEGFDKPGTAVHSLDWRIRVEPTQVGDRLTDPINQGHIAAAGGLSNLREKDGVYIPYYEWKTGSRMTTNAGPGKEDIAGDSNGEYHFSISFQAKPPFMPLLWLPWAALFISFASLVITLIAICD